MHHPYTFIFALSIFAVLSFASDPRLSEAQVFEWWDNGIIDSDEAREILDRLEEGNTQEACMLAEVYALESCTDTGPGKKRRETRPTTKPKKTKVKPRPSIAPHGHIEWQGRTDSLGHLESQRTEMQVQFYRYTLRLGSQSLLAYKNAGSEAYLGQISTKELHSVIPLDTLWGTALLYPLGMFRAGALLDTARTTRASVGISPAKTFELELAYWHRAQQPKKDQGDTVLIPPTERHSISAQARGDWGQFAVWWIPEDKENFPLIKLQLHLREKTDFATLAWKADAYAHGEILPQESRLSPTIERQKFWGSQTAGATFDDRWKSKLALSARTMVPLEGDTSKTRFKVALETGPSQLKGNASATCMQAEDHCRQNNLSFKLRSTWDLWSYAAKLQTTYTQGEGFGIPLYEAGINYTMDANNSTGAAVTIPKGTPASEIRIRSSTEIGTDLLQFSLAVTFRRTAETQLHPHHAAIKAKVMF